MIKKNVIANPSVVLREEFDDWALLFDPDTGEVYGINPVSVFIWGLLDGKHTEEEIVKQINKKFENTPVTVIDEVKSFIDSLVKNGLAGFEA
jgi:SynChlorMet cassette protein ScmD